MGFRYQIREPGKGSWSGSLSRGAVMQRFLEQHIDRHWLISPKDYSMLSITVGEFVDDPSIFDEFEKRFSLYRSRKFMLNTIETNANPVTDCLLHAATTIIFIAGLSLLVLAPMSLVVGILAWYGLLHVNYFYLVATPSLAAVLGCIAVLAALTLGTYWRTPNSELENLERNFEREVEMLVLRRSSDKSWRPE